MVGAGEEREKGREMIENGVRETKGGGAIGQQEKGGDWSGGWGGGGERQGLSQDQEEIGDKETTTSIYFFSISKLSTINQTN